ncbi:MAG: hypothetical protein V7638_3349, partial [Acidobacteriota bacterium]
MKLTYSLLLLLVIGLLASSALVRSYAGRNPTKLDTGSVAPVLNDDVPQVVSLQVTPSGFEPRETIAPKG